VSTSASWTALGTTATVLVERAAALGDARAAVEQELAAIDRACSRFRADSELSRLNAARGLRMAVSELLLEAIAAAQRAARLTGGAVDPTIGGALIRAGYDRDFDAIERSGKPPQPLRAAGATHPARPLRAPGWMVLEVDAEAGTVRIPAGVVLDLGATAKALAADRAARSAARAAGSGVLVNLGGDLATAGPPPDGGWVVRVADDHRAEAGEAVRIRSGALATSSTAVRRWSRGAVTVHHILDPATGAPAEGPWRTVSVAAATCVDANTAATAAIVRGESAAAWLERLALPARLHGEDGTVLRIAGWPR
jgi:FAD:protein FMN transferase